MTNCKCTSHGHLPKGATRRDILTGALAGAGLIALGPMGRLTSTARAAAVSQKRIVVVNMAGGCDTLNMLVPTYLQPYHDRRPSIAIQPEDGLGLDSGPGRTSKYVLHPTMPNLAQLWRDGDVAAVQRVGYPRATLSHFASEDVLSLGVRNGFTNLGRRRSGWIARFADLHAAHPLGAVSVGVGRPLDFLGGSSNPFLVDRLDRFRLQKGGRSFAEDTPEHLHRIGAAREAIERWSKPGNSSDAKVALAQAHDLAEEIQVAAEFDSPAAYDTGERLSRQLRDIGRLINHGFDTKVFYTGTGGFDTHGDQGAGTEEGRQGRLFKRMDIALGAFAEDMKAQGVWNQMVVCVITEFGRRNFENGSGGTDHGHGFCELLIGGGVKGGMYGPLITEEDMAEDWMPYEVDFRSIYKEVLRDHMGVNPDPIFPEALEQTHNLNVV